MATDIIEGIATRNEYLQAVQLSYTPVSLALTNRIKHDVAGAETIKFRQLDVEKESIVAEALTAGQTETAHIKAKEGQKTFYKILKGAKIIQSTKNFGYNRIPELISQVVRGYSIIFDKQVMFGADGNNGIIGSADPNAIRNEAVQINPDAAPQEVLNAVVKLVSGLKRKVSATTASTDVIVYVYGSDLLSALDIVVYNGGTVREAVQKNWPDAMFVEVPELVNSANVQGFSVVSRELVALNYTKIPDVSDDGYNREDKYFWADFEVGSAMVDVREYGALIEQPVTIAA